MKNYYVESIIEEIAENIKDLIEKGIIDSKKKIYLYGLDTFSTGMKTILSNMGYRIDSYILEDEIQVINENRRIKTLLSRYCNEVGRKKAVSAKLLMDKRKEKKDFVILVVSKEYDRVKEKLNMHKYIENEDYFNVFNWENDYFVENMKGKKKLNIADIQFRLKEMLRNIDNYCLEHNIQYWVCGGTLLGTIRHKGFIPWDDDVDIFMPLPDYKKFIASFCLDGMYSLIGPDITDRSLYSELFSKIIDDKTIVREDSGVVRKIHPIAIDVFPIIGVPEEARARASFFANYYELEKCIWEDFYKKNGSMEVYNKWYKYQKEYLEKYDYNQSEYVGVIATAYRERDFTSKQVYSGTLRKPFEDIEVNVPTGYKEYLDNLYGSDWGDIPSEEKRKSHHNMMVFEYNNL